jgi:hypothetical protein
MMRARSRETGAAGAAGMRRSWITGAAAVVAVMLAACEPAVGQSSSIGKEVTTEALKMARVARPMSKLSASRFFATAANGSQPEPAKAAAAANTPPLRVGSSTPPAVRSYKAPAATPRPTDWVSRGANTTAVVINVHELNMFPAAPSCPTDRRAMHAATGGAAVILFLRAQEEVFH